MPIEFEQIASFVEDVKDAEEAGYIGWETQDAVEAIADAIRKEDTRPLEEFAENYLNLGQS